MLTTAAIYAASFALTGLFVRDITLKEFEEQRKTSDGDAGEVELTSSQGPSLSPLTAGTGTESESGPEIGKEMGAGAETALTRGGLSREQRQGRKEAAAVGGPQPFTIAAAPTAQRPRGTSAAVSMKARANKHAPTVEVDQPPTTPPHSQGSAQAPVRTLGENRRREGAEAGGFPAQVTSSGT